jgi:hypothetical protein
MNENPYKSPEECGQWPGIAIDQVLAIVGYVSMIGVFLIVVLAAVSFVMGW